MQASMVKEVWRQFLLSLPHVEPENQTLSSREQSDRIETNNMSEYCTLYERTFNEVNSMIVLQDLRNKISCHTQNASYIR